MKKTKWIRAAIIIAAALAVLITGLILLKQDEEKQYQEVRGTMSEGFGQLKTVEINGKKYREKPAVTTLLIAGIDKTDAETNATAKNYRNGGQADFLILLAIDHTDRKIHQMQIDRDTMTEVVTLGIFGNEAGTRVQQICLAHAYGLTPEDNAKYTIRAVQNLLSGIEIDGYYMVDYSAVPVLTDALGGVPVKIEFDMTSVNPEWKQGSSVTLRGKEAETFVRTRKTIGEGTNEERMVRQGEFMRSAINRMRQKINNDIGYAETLVETLQGLSVTNMTTKRLAEELKEIHGYEVLPVDHPAGEYTIGSDGFVEFHMQDGAAVEWVLEHLFSETK